ncbi:MAG TPA: SPOR domain-containing protein [Geminicoccaceae bacterium]|nr:SPOR domain-containing protein [Geminicoccaceae bacterium]
MPDPITPNSPAGAGRAVPEPPPAPWLQPRRSRLLLVGLPMFAVFAAFGAIIWVAYEHGSDGAPVGEPPLVRAPAVALKLAPEDDGAAVGEGGEGGEVLDLLSDTLPSDQLERLLPPPEEPLAPVVAEREPAPPVEPGELPSAIGELPPPAPTPSVAATPSPAEVAPALPAVAATPPPAPPRDTPLPEGQQAAAAPAPPASPPLPTPEEAEATLDALLAEVTRETDRARDQTPPGPTQVARSEPLAPRPGASDQVRPAVVPPAPPPAPRPAPAATVAPFTPPAPVASATPPGSEVTPIARDQILARPSATGPRPTSEPALERAPERTDVAAVGGSYRIQLAAVRGEADARRAWDLFLDDLGPVLSGLQSFIERADTANGVFYRVQVGPFASQQAAESLCDELKQRNASCFVIRR